MNKILAFFLSFVLLCGVINYVEVDAKEISLPVPVIKVKVINSGKAVKVTISKTKDAEGFEVFAYGKSIDYSEYKEVNDKYQKVAEIKENGEQKRTITINALPSGSYKLKVRSYNNWKFGTLKYSSFSKEKSFKIKKSANGYTSFYDFSSVERGNIVNFGTYEQDGNFLNGMEPIEWVVLEKKKDRLLLLSKYVLECMPYNYQNGREAITWEYCSLRKWLNSKFFENAFNTLEKNMIYTTEVENYDNAKYGTTAGNDTKDKVFLLSQLEIIDTDYGFSNSYSAADINRRCAFVWEKDKPGIADARTYDGAYTCWWWLRSPGMFTNSAVCVNRFGRADWEMSAGSTYAGNEGYGGVRPAIVVNLVSDKKEKASTETEDNLQTYKIDLDGDGKKENIKYTLKSTYLEESDKNSFDFKLYINGSVALRDKGEGYDISKGVEFIDINPKDKFVELMVYYEDEHDGYRTGLHGYRYKNGKLKLLFKSDNTNALGFFGKFSEKQQKNNNIRFLEAVNCAAGGIYIKRDYKIKNRQLVPIKAKNDIYPVYEKWYVTNEWLFVYGDSNLKGFYSNIIYSGEEIKIKKIKYRDETASHNDGIFDDVISAYIESREGVKGWIDMDINHYDGIIVENEQGLLIPM